MTKRALSEISSPQSLGAAFRSLYRRSKPRSRNTRGIDDVSINDFAFDPKPALRKLSRDLRDKKFVYSSLRPHLIPKPNRKDRLICVPTVRDRIVQRALLDYITERYSTRLRNPISYGFVKGRTVEEAALRGCEHRASLPWVFKTDITSFFDQVPRPQLALELKRYLRQKSLHPLLIAASECEIQSPDSISRQRRIAKLGIVAGRGVRQGMPLSPFFANVLLEKFDRAVVSHGFKAIRYADDLIFFASNKSECEAIHEFCKHELSRFGLSVPDIGPDSKSQIYSPSEPAEFLGLGLCKDQDRYVLRLMPAQIEKVRMELLAMGNIHELLARGITLAKLSSQIANRSTGYYNAYDMCANIKELEQVCDDLTQRLLRKIYRDELGINLEKLSSDARTFLGLT